jgi:hypothetical protein
MALITEPRGTTAQNPAPAARPEVTFGKPAQTTARVDALKQKLSNTVTTTNPVAPRPAGSTARAEQYAKLQSHVAPKAPVAQHTQPLQDIEPPPSGMVTNAAPTDATVPQLDTSVGDTETAAEAPSEPLSPQFVALAKQERQLRKARQELKVQQDAWKAKQASMVSIDDLKTDPLGTMSKLGLTYDQLTELQLSQINPDPNQQLLNKISELEAKLATVDEQFTKRDNAAYEAAVNQIRNDVKLLVDSDPAYETIKATGESEAVVELIRKVFDAEGTILSVEEASQLVEEKLLEREVDRLNTLQKLSKIQSRLGKRAEKPVEASELQQQPVQTTLSNAGTVSRPLTARERAIMAFETAKKKV